LIQSNDDAGKHHAVKAARYECLAAHADKDFLVGRDILGIKMPMTVRHASSGRVLISLQCFGVALRQAEAVTVPIAAEAGIGPLSGLPALALPYTPPM
jgi:hypothetical protein